MTGRLAKPIGTAPGPPAAPTEPPSRRAQGDGAHHDVFAPRRRPAALVAPAQVETRQDRREHAVGMADQREADDRGVPRCQRQRRGTIPGEQNIGVRHGLVPPHLGRIRRRGGLE